MSVFDFITLTVWGTYTFGQMSTTYEEQTRHSITMHVENLVFFALYWTDSIQLSLCILACSEPHNEDVERRQILKLSSTNSEMKSIYKHHLKLHLIWALGQDNFSVQDFLSRALDFVPVGISVGSDLLFAYRTEIKISWIKLFVFQFRTFLTGWISSSPAQHAKCNAICVSLILLFYLPPNNWIITILITRNTFGNLIQIFHSKCCVCVGLFVFTCEPKLFGMGFLING